MSAESANSYDMRKLSVLTDEQQTSKINSNVAKSKLSVQSKAQSAVQSVSSDNRVDT